MSVKLTNTGFEVEYTEETARKNFDNYVALFKGCDPVSELESLRAQLKEALEVVARMIEGDGECRLDHHGYCQEHRLELDCSVKRAREFLAKYPEVKP